MVFFRNGPFFGAAEREVRNHRSEDEAAIGGQADFSTAGRRREKWKPWNDATSAADAASVDDVIVVVRHRCRRKSLSTLVVGCRPKAQFGFFRCHRRRRRKNVEMNSGGCEIKRENAERAKSPDQVRHLRFIFSSLLKILSFISFAECILNLSSFISEL